MSRERKLVFASILLSGALLLGRLAGFVREIQIGSVFGISRDSDLAVVMLTTPDLLVNLLLAGGITAALIPEFVRLDAGGRVQVFFRVSLYVLILFGAIGLLLALFPQVQLLAFAPGYAGLDKTVFGNLFAMAALAIPLAGLSGVTAAFLNSHERFFIVGAGTLVFNATIIVALFWWGNADNTLFILAVAIATAALLRYCSQLIFCFPYLARSESLVPATKLSVLATRFFQALGASTIVLVIPVMLRAIVSLVGEGHIAAFNFATKLVELPLGIAITTIGAVSFPALSKALVDETGAETQIFEDGLKRSLILSLCIMTSCIWFAPAIVRLAFGYGQMTDPDLALVADLARIAFATLPLVAISSMSSAMLNARGQMGLSLKITALAALVAPLAALPGILLSDVRLTIAALPVFQLVLAVVALRATRFPVSWDWVRKSIFRPVVASAIGTALCAIVVWLSGTESAVVGTGLAMVAIVLALFCSGSLTRRATVT